VLTSIVGKVSKEEDDILPIATTLSISVSHSSFCTSIPLKTSKAPFGSSSLGAKYKAIKFSIY
jgi:hypothetical protein